MPKEQVHAKVSQPGHDAATRTEADDDVDQAIEDAIDRAVEENETLATTDALLDEIDELLEGNAEDFVRNYIQKGGQAVRVFLDAAARGFGVAWRFPWADQRLI